MTRQLQSCYGVEGGGACCLLVVLVSFFPPQAHCSAKVIIVDLGLSSI